MPYREVVRAAVDELYRNDSRRIFASLVRLVGDFELAEEAMHDAFAAAIEKWSTEGIPRNPRAWMVSTGRFKAIDVIRRRSRFDASLEEFGRRLESRAETQAIDGERVEDDRLRLIFTCCHPLLSPEVQIALTLREVCGLTTEEIARAFLASPATVAQRIVRGKSKIREAKIPFEVPQNHELAERLDSVLRVIYLVFTEGYSASSGDSVTRADLSSEAIRLGRLLDELMQIAETKGLLALMLLQESRRQARMNEAGELVMLADQDRSLWDRAAIQEGCECVQQALALGEVGPYTIQAAIAAVHATAEVDEVTRAPQTDWPRIVHYYDILMQIQPSPIVELNRAVAVAMHAGPREGLRLIEAIFADGHLHSYHLAHAAKADFCRQLGEFNEARQAYTKALELATQQPEKRFLTERLSQLGVPQSQNAETPETR